MTLRGSLPGPHVLMHTQQSTVPPGVAEHNVTVARAFTKLMGAFVTFWDNDAGSKIHLLARTCPHQSGQEEDSLLELQMRAAVLALPYEQEGRISAIQAGPYASFYGSEVHYVGHKPLAKLRKSCRQISRSLQRLLASCLAKNGMSGKLMDLPEP